METSGSRLKIKRYYKQLTLHKDLLGVLDRFELNFPVVIFTINSHWQMQNSSIISCEWKKIPPIIY